MRILVDAMGGDLAPKAAALGAIRAAQELGTEVVLVGRGEAILQCLKENGVETLPKGVEIANAEDVVDMHDDPAAVVRKRKDSSMVVGLRMLAEGGGDAFISAGSTGALLTAATLVVKRIKGIRRAAMGPVIPTKAGGGAVLIDCGANAECTPEFLLQFAFMGSYYAQKTLKLGRPRVGLLNIGTEDSKGGALQKEAYALLKKAGDAGYLNFIGNVEARDVPLGGADVVVADGFAGNVLLKGIEGMEAEIPQAMYETRMDEMVNDFAFRVEQQGLRLEDYLKYMGQTVEQFRASFMPQAEKQVKIRLALEAVAAAENIEASEEEVSAEIKRIADQYKMEEDKVRELVNVDDLKKDLAVNKAIDFIKSHANVVEKAAEAEKTEDAE